MDFVMITDLTKLPKVIEYNHEELKKQLSAELEKYRNIAVTEGDMASAKADRAALNKFKDAVETKRKEVKKEYLEPYNEFEKKIKEIVSMVDEPIKVIDSQIKEIEAVKKEEKKKEIEKLYKENIGCFNELIPLDKIWNGRWLNVTYKLEDIALEIETAAGRAQSGVEIIKGLNSEFEGQIMDKFFQTLDITAALQENKRLSAQQKQIDKLTEKRELQGRVTEEEKIREIKPCQPEQEKTIAHEENEQQTICLDFRVFVTSEQAVLLKEFLISNGIKYGRVPATA